jgi:predicted nucleic acid-binding protein
MIPGCLLDTSFLITLASRERPRHAVARDYFRHCLDVGIPLYLSTLAVMEFYRRQRLDALGLHNFLILPFNFDEAVLAGQFAETLKPVSDDVEASRASVQVDVGLLAQAKANGVRTILTEDAETLKRFCDRLREIGRIDCHSVLLTEGFDPSRLENPGAPGLAFPSQPEDSA